MNKNSNNIDNSDNKNQHKHGWYNNSNINKIAIVIKILIQVSKLVDYGNTVSIININSDNNNLSEYLIQLPEEGESKQVE